MTRPSKERVPANYKCDACGQPFVHTHNAQRFCKRKKCREDHRRAWFAKDRERHTKGRRLQFSEELTEPPIVLAFLDYEDLRAAIRDELGERYTSIEIRTLARVPDERVRVTPPDRFVKGGRPGPGRPPRKP